MTRRLVMIGALVVAGAAGPATALGQAPVPIPGAPPLPAPAPTAPVEPVEPVEPKPARGRIADGVTIDGVAVGGLTRRDATRLLLAERVKPSLRPVLVVFRGRRLPVRPAAAGYRADVRYAARAAYNFGRSRPLAAEMPVPLRESVNAARVRSIVGGIAGRLDTAPRDAAISFRGTRAVVTRARIGVQVDRSAAERIVREAILTRARTRYVLPAARVRPSRTAAPPAVLIERSRFRLTLFRGGGRQTFGVAVGQPAYPTPAGTFTIVSKQTNPTWFPPSSPWAAGLGPQPPGVDNPLGTRWMGTSAPAIGIHGTPVPSSIGTAASHGCIRMRIPEAEYLYELIEIGTVVKIV